MPSRVILLSGPIAAGKSSLCRSLAERCGAKIVKTWECLVAQNPTIEKDRRALQQYGEELDKATGGRWIVPPLKQIVDTLDPDALVVVDSIRLKGQADAIRGHYGSHRVIHIHLTAPLSVLEKRYKKRVGKEIRELKNYKDTQENKTEKNVWTLKDTADIVIDTQRCTAEDVYVKAASQLNVFGKEYSRCVDVLVGGQYGSEGKGQVANFLGKEYDYLIRVGGPNAGHKVYEEPHPYTYHSLPSGTRSSAATIIIGPGATISLPVLLKEIADCSLDKRRLIIDEQCTIITDEDRKREHQIVQKIGSTGQGVGQATARRIVDRGRGVILAKHIPVLRPYIKSAHEVLESAFSKGCKLFLEGTQGTGLSLYHGNYPHVTSRDTSVAGCLAEAGISPSRVRKVILVCRTYPIRVQNGRSGTSGPMRQEISLKVIAERSGLSLRELKSTERTSTTNRQRRIAEFDWVLLRKAASLNAPTDIALTFADYLASKNREARRFEQLHSDTIRFIEDVEKTAKAPVSLISTRFDYRSIIDRRHW